MKRLRFFFDVGSGTCLWAANDRAQSQFGYAVDLSALPLAHDVIVRGEALVARFNTSIDWHDPGGPSILSIAEVDRFNEDSNEFLCVLRSALGSDFDVLNEAT